MTRTELIAKIEETLQTEQALTSETNLDSIEEWDSLGVISIISLYDQLFSMTIRAEVIESCSTVEDLIQLVSSNIEGN